MKNVLRIWHDVGAMNIFTEEEFVEFKWNWIMYVYEHM